MEWILREAPDDWKSLVPDGMPKILGRLLAQRGVEAESVERFLRPKLAQLSDPFEIAEMDLAVERVLLAVDAGEEICIYGDYDVDGVSSIAVLSSVLQAYGLSPSCFVPHRSGEGYGLSDGGVARSSGMEIPRAVK